MFPGSVWIRRTIVLGSILCALSPLFFQLMSRNSPIRVELREPRIRDGVLITPVRVSNVSYLAVERIAADCELLEVKAEHVWKFPLARFGESEPIERLPPSVASQQ